MIGKMNFKFSKHAIQRIKERNIKEEWIIEAIKIPDEIVEVSDTEHRYFKIIKDFDNRVLKVVLNPESNIIITVYFDRGKKL
ncbi:DUF4258 domain-containing protein [Persephonella sp.]|uniref:DUF4258 domain-containing protein n=1 Tax=Persephonella sp. TaxID=2060922 RepID=UPI0025D8B01A|nr:DUF4258 domain-containing protein [Persephonella sp.]